MSTRRKRWLIGGAAALAAAALLTLAAGFRLAKRFDPYIRQQSIEYLSQRFDSDVQIGKLNVSIPRIPLMSLVWNHGKGVIARVTGEDVVMRRKGASSALPPIFSMGRFQFETDLGGIFDPVKLVSNVRMEGMEIQIPPKENRPEAAAPTAAAARREEIKIAIDRVTITDSRLLVLPRDPARKPLEFDLFNVVLDSVGAGQPFRYRARLTNAMPPGMIEANGRFGPWNSVSPGDTLLDGEYSLQNAELGVFSAIQGTLNSRGSFAGSLASMEVKGEADVPDFSLRDVGNPMLLHVNFEAKVDGTNGDTILKPVRALLGTTVFTTSGAILKRDPNPTRSIDLNVNMPDGEMLDLLRLVAKAKPFMSGRLQMSARIRIPPFKGSVSGKLILDGVFHVRRGQFLESAVQTQIDTLSRRGQGQPRNQSIGNVFSDMAGQFHLENQNIRFQSLSFEVPGSRVDLTGRYEMTSTALDFRGSLRLDARVSQTVTGWKHWVLKAADPFFAKRGAGTFVKIKVTGTAQDPHFGLAR